MPDADPAFQFHAFMIAVILPSGSGLGVCNKEIILKKSMKDNHCNFLLYADFSRCYFYEISQGCGSTLLGIPTTIKV